jgi:hypothetical protein
VFPQCRSTLASQRWLPANLSCLPQSLRDRKSLPKLRGSVCGDRARFVLESNARSPLSLANSIRRAFSSKSERYSPQGSLRRKSRMKLRNRNSWTLRTGRPLGLRAMERRRVNGITTSARKRSATTALSRFPPRIAAIDASGRLTPSGTPARRGALTRRLSWPPGVLRTPATKLSQNRPNRQFSKKSCGAERLSTSYRTARIFRVCGRRPDWCCSRQITDDGHERHFA